MKIYKSFLVRSVLVLIWVSFARAKKRFHLTRTPGAFEADLLTIFDNEDPNDVVSSPATEPPPKNQTSSSSEKSSEQEKHPHNNYLSLEHSKTLFVARENRTTKIPMEKIFNDLTYIEVLNITQHEKHQQNTNMNMNINLTNYYQEYNALELNDTFVDFSSLKYGFGVVMGLQMITTNEYITFYSINDERVYQMSTIKISDLFTKDILDSHQSQTPIAISVDETYNIQTLNFFLEVKAKRIDETSNSLKFDYYLVYFVYKCVGNPSEKSRDYFECTHEINSIFPIERNNLFDEDGNKLDMECQKNKLYQNANSLDSNLRYLYRFCSVQNMQLDNNMNFYNEIQVYSFYNSSKLNVFTIGYFEDKQNKLHKIQAIAYEDWRKRIFFQDVNGIFIFDNLNFHYKTLQGKMVLLPPLISFDTFTCINIMCINIGNDLVSCQIKYTEKSHNFDRKQTAEPITSVNLKIVGFFLRKQNRDLIGKIISVRETYLLKTVPDTDYVIFQNYAVLIMNNPENDVSGEKTLKILDLKNQHRMLTKKVNNFLLMKKFSKNFNTALDSDIGFLVEKTENGFKIIPFSIQIPYINFVARSIDKDSYCSFYQDKCQRLTAKLIYKEFTEEKSMDIPFFQVGSDFNSVLQKWNSSTLEIKIYGSSQRIYFENYFYGYLTDIKISSTAVFDDDYSTLQPNFLEFNFLKDITIEMDTKIIDNGIPLPQSYNPWAVNPYSDGLELDKNSLISLSIYRDKTISLTITKIDFDYPFTSLKRLCVYVLRDRFSFHASSQIHLTGVEQTPRCYTRALFFNGSVGQIPEGYTQLFLIIRDDLKIGLLSFNSETLNFRYETNFELDWGIPKTELSSVWGVKSYMGYAIQNIIVISTLTHMYIYNLETDSQNGYIVNLQGIFNYTNFFSFNGYIDLKIKDFVVWRGNILVMYIHFYNIVENSYQRQIVFIYMDLTEDFFPFLLAYINITSYTEENRDNQVQDTDFKIFLSDKHYTLMLIDRPSKNFKIFSMDNVQLNPITFGKDLKPIDEYGFMKAFDGEGMPIDLVSNGGNKLINSIGDEFLTILSYEKKDCVVAIDIYGKIYSPIVRKSCFPPSTKSLLKKSYIPLNLISLDKPEYGAIAWMEDSILQLKLLYFKNGVDVNQIPIISRATTDQFSYKLTFNDIVGREFVHNLVLKTETNDQILIKGSNNVIEIPLYDTYMLPFDNIFIGYVESQALKCQGNSKQTYYQMNYNDECSIVCDNIHVSLKHNFRNIYEYTDFADLGYVPKEDSIEYTEKNFQNELNINQKGDEANYGYHIESIRSSGSIKDLPAVRFILHKEFSILLLSGYSRIVHNLKLYKYIYDEKEKKYQKQFINVNKCDNIIFIGKDKNSENYVIFLYCGGILNSRTGTDQSFEVIAAKLPFFLMNDYYQKSIDEIDWELKKNINSHNIYSGVNWDLPYLEIPDCDHEMRYSLELKQKISFDEKYFALPRRHYLGSLTKVFLSIFEIKYYLVREKEENYGLKPLDSKNSESKKIYNQKKEFNDTYTVHQIQDATTGEIPLEDNEPEYEPGARPENSLEKECIFFDEIETTLNNMIDIYPPYDFAIFFEESYTRLHDNGILNLYVFSSSLDPVIHDSRLLKFYLNSFAKPETRSYDIVRDFKSAKNYTESGIIPYLLIDHKNDLILQAITDTDYIYQYKLQYKKIPDHKNPENITTQYFWVHEIIYNYSTKTKDLFKFNFFQNESNLFPK